MTGRARCVVTWSYWGWIWLVAFLALPNCSFQSGFIGVPPNLDPGEVPHTSAIFCDIEQERRCATADDLASGIRLASAAVALVGGQSSAIGLDESPDARARCGGQPEAVVYYGSFPAGSPACLNCSVIGPPPALYPTAADACVKKCEDIVAPNVVPATPEVEALCQSNARPATNLTAAAPETCFTGACTDGGMLLPDFADPWREPEPVIWRDLIGVSATGDDLTRTAATTTTFDAGAASEQWITRGDAYVEFSASETTLSHVAGLAEFPSTCAFPCTDTDPSLNDIDFAVSLNFDGRFYVIESGLLITGPAVNGSFGTYATGERFRVTLHDNADGTATVAYSRLTGTCTPGMPCPEAIFYTHTGLANYPLRADASFRETGATLADVRVVRIR